MLTIRRVGEVGNGRATAILLARQGARVALIDNNEEWAQGTKDMIDAEGGISEVVQADVTDETSCQKAVKRTVELFGSLSILVNIGESQQALKYRQQADNLCSRCWGCHGRRDKAGLGGLGS